MIFFNNIALFQQRKTVLYFVLFDSFKSFAAKFQNFKVSKWAILITKFIDSNLENTILNSKSDGNFSVLTFSCINKLFSQSAFKIDKCYIIKCFLK